MNLMKNKNLIQFITLVILASCSTSPENLYVQPIKPQKNNAKNLKAMYAYQSFFPNDIKIIQRAIDNGALNKEQLRDAKLLKSNYQKILSKKRYSIELSFGQQYSKEIIELIYKLNLPINISWSEKKQNSLPENILSKKINSFCFIFIKKINLNKQYVCNCYQKPVIIWDILNRNGNLLLFCFVLSF